MDTTQEADEKLVAKAEAAEQISVFLENRPGIVARLFEALREQGGNIRAMTVLDTVDIGTLRMVVDDVKRAKEALKNCGAAYVAIPVLAIAVPNEPGALGTIARLMADAGINIEYAYASVLAGSKGTLCIFRVNDQDKALSLSYQC